MGRNNSKAYIIRYDNLPAQKNRAIYQRPLYMSRRMRTTLITSSGSDICNNIKDKVDVVYIPFGKLRKLTIIGQLIWNIFAALFITIFLFRKQNIIVYTFHRQGFLAGGMLKLVKRKRIKLICDMQHTPYYYLDAAMSSQLTFIKRSIYYLVGLIHILLAKLVLPRADLVCAMSLSYEDGFAKLIHDGFKVKYENLLPIPNGTDINLLDKYYKPIKSNKKQIRILYAGNMQAERLEYTLKILEKFSKFDKKLEMIICGNLTPEAKKILQSDSRSIYINHMGIIEHEKLLNLYNEVDLVFVTIDVKRRDHKYSHPGKLFESMGMRKVTLSSDFNLAQKIIADGVNGFIIQDDDLGGTVEEIYHALRNTEIRHNIELNAYNTSKKFDWSILNEKWWKKIVSII